QSREQRDVRGGQRVAARGKRVERLPVAEEYGPLVFGNHQLRDELQLAAAGKSPHHLPAGAVFPLEDFDRHGHPPRSDFQAVGFLRTSRRPTTWISSWSAASASAASPALSIA